MMFPTYLHGNVKKRKMAEGGIGKISLKKSVLMEYTLPSVPWSCKGCPVVSWRSWLGDRVNLLPWNWRVTGVSGWEMRFWAPAMLASWAIFTTSPPSREWKNTTLHQNIIIHSLSTATHWYIASVSFRVKQKKRHAEPGWVNQWDERSRPPQQNQSSLYLHKPWRGKKMPKRAVLKSNREPETYTSIVKHYTWTALDCLFKATHWSQGNIFKDGYK